jgi:hypothetical protein
MRSLTVVEHVSLDGVIEGFATHPGPLADMVHKPPGSW